MNFSPQDSFLAEWLDKEYESSLEKVRAGKHTHEDFFVLLLKYQTNHISHLEIDIDKRFDSIDKKFDAVDKRFEALNEKIEQTNQSNNQRFNKLEKDIVWLRAMQAVTLVAVVYPIVKDFIS